MAAVDTARIALQGFGVLSSGGAAFLLRQFWIERRAPHQAAADVARAARPLS
jgi:hypothetical protein